MWECGVKNSLCLPHARGGVSLMHGVGYEPLQSSPRTWGCFLQKQNVALSGAVFPTHVGVFLSISEIILSILCLPHARGGVSATTSSSSPLRLSSPRTWGCFYTQLFDAKAQEVFPTHVGVFLLGSFLLMFARRLPHARGGVSWLTYAVMLLVGSSPRTWGCFHSSQ